MIGKPTVVTLEDGRVMTWKTYSMQVGTDYYEWTIYTWEDGTLVVPTDTLTSQKPLIRIDSSWVFKKYWWISFE